MTFKTIKCEECTCICGADYNHLVKDLLHMNNGFGKLENHYLWKIKSYSKVRCYKWQNTGLLFIQKLFIQLQMM